MREHFADLDPGDFARLGVDVDHWLELGGYRVRTGTHQLGRVN